MNLSMIISASKFITQVSTVNLCGLQQIRNKWNDWRTIRDVKRRRMNAEFFNDRLRIKGLMRNDILPIEIREQAAKDITTFPLNSTRYRINDRCCITSRPRGIVYRWRLSRIKFRELADHNTLAGVQRAMW